MGSLNNITKSFLVIILIFIAQWTMAADYYVDAIHGSEANDGETWMTALRSISEAMARMPDPGDNIHVAEGTYYEEVNLQPGVIVLGGYPSGGGTRDWTLYDSIIHGEGTHRCAVGADDAVLDGFLLVHGQAKSGGGIAFSRVTMTVNNCRFVNCVATHGTPFGGGAVYFYLSDSVLSNCTFEDNSVQLSPDSAAGEAMGGAVMLWAAGGQIINCTFRNNQVMESPFTETRLGGAIWGSSCTPSIRNCVFENNSAVSGGAIGWWNRSTPNVENCQFTANSAASLGGAICHIYNESDVQETECWVRNSLFDSNVAEFGGAILITRNNLVAVENCLFTGNTGLMNGAAVSVQESSVRINHCTVADNICIQSGGTGGVINLDSTCSTTVTNSIIAFNTGSSGIELESGGQASEHVIRNCNFWNPNCRNNFSKNLVDRIDWQGNFSADPLFTWDMDTPYTLSEPATGDSSQKDIGRSPCIDVGDHPADGYPEHQMTTRTDLALDNSDADLGWHRLIDGAYLLADSPYAGEYDVATESDVRCRLIVNPDLVEPGDLSGKIDGEVVTLQAAELSDGFALILQPDDFLPDNSQISVEIEVASQSITDSFFYVFSTASATVPPAPPLGSFFELRFPMMRNTFSSGDNLGVRLEIYNPWLNDLISDVHIAFEYAGEFYFYPVWDQELHAVNRELFPGEIQNLDLLSFEVPEGTPACGPFNFYALCTSPGTLNPQGDIAVWSMYFN